MDTASEGMSIESFIKSFSPQVKKLAWSLMRNYSGWFNDAGEEINDLYGAGMLELISIFNRVNFQESGYRSYVLQRVRGCMLNYIYKNIPNSEYIPAVDDEIRIADSGKRARRFIRPVPIDEVIETSYEPEDELQIDILIFRHQVQSLIEEFMDGLGSIERFIMISRFYDEKTYEEIGGVTGMRRETVSRKIGLILKKLGNFLRLKCSWRLSLDELSDYLQDAYLSVMIISDQDTSHTPDLRRRYI